MSSIFYVVIIIILDFLYGVLLCYNPGDFISMRGVEMAVPEDVGCKNEHCIKWAQECKRAKIAREGKAREIKSFGGTPEKGCGKFLPIDK